jgi:pimeloyl-ACP methyl ester carboxylesterase
VTIARDQLFVEFDGCRFEYEDLPGDPALAPLLFLHEGLGSVGLWRGFHHQVATASGRRTLAYSRLGHGLSDPPSQPREISFMHDEAATVLPALLECWGVRKPVLVSHSDGASIALLHAATHPVSGVVAMAPHVFVEDISIQGIETARDDYRDGDLRRRMSRHHRDPDVTFRGWNDVWLDPEFRSWNIVATLGTIRCPMLLVQGEDDQYGSLAQLDAIEQAVPGDVRREVLACGHSPHLESPEPTLRAIADFLETL